MVLFDSVAVTNRGVYVPEPLFSRGLGDVSVGGYFEISLDLFAFLIVLAGGIFVSRQIAKRADAQQEATGVRPKTWYLRLGVIAIPLLVLMVALGFHLGLPELKGFNFQGGTYMRNSLIALWLALSLYTAAFIAENVRAGILAISKGQTEAAAALGLRPRRITSLVVLPQALRVIIPPLISQYLNLTKNSSLAIAVGYMDITGTLMGITLNQTGRELETVLLGMLIYLTISLVISAVMNWYNSRVKLVER
jgi:general L-amino acid transport system permease protein